MRAYRVVPDTTRGRVPEGYQEVEWLRNEPDSDHPENWGWFETDIVPTPSTGYEFSMLWKNRGMNTGVRWTLGPTYDTFAFAIGTYSGSSVTPRTMNFLYGRYSSNYLKTLSTYFRQDTEYNHHISFINKHYKIEDNTTGTVIEEGNVTVPSFSTPNIYKFYIGLYNLQGSPSGSGSGWVGYAKFGEFKMYEGSTVVRDYVPCYRKSDGKVFMYDLLNETFLEGKGAFGIGPDYFPYKTIAPLIPARIGIDSAVGVKALMTLAPNKVIYKSPLPDAYQEVEWIGGTGTQYINSGLQLTDGFKSESMVMVLGEGTSSSYLPGRYMGCHNASAPYNRNHHSFITDTGTSSNRLEVASGGAGYYQSTSFISNDTWFKYEADNTTNVPTAKVNGVTFALTNAGGTTGAGTRAGYDIFVFATNQAGTPYITTHLRAKYIKIWSKAGVLLRDYYPCYRKSDGKTGMYDLENGVFYPNIGTGEFEKGANIG